MQCLKNKRDVIGEDISIPQDMKDLSAVWTAIELEASAFFPA